VTIAALFAVIAVLLLCATGIGLLLRRPGRSLRDYFDRLRSWWIVTTTMLVVVASVPWLRGLPFALLILLALRECWLALWPRHAGLFIVAALWILGGLGCLQYWLWRGDGQALLAFCWVLLLTQLNDIAQYFAGKAFGRHRITPVISPNKTWEGFAGGVAFSVVASLALSPVLLGFDLMQALVFGLAIGCGGFAGDILFSWVKRRAGIKDFGAVLPGQGGVLDRLDSATVTAPLVQLLLFL
jgi:predicted CDP-diglyceride synthetase/phosphatidate cytidylyltransferase